MTIEETSRLIEAALGKLTLDSVIVNVHVLNVYTGRIERDSVIGILGERVAHVGKDAGGRIGPKTLVTDAAGAYALPGLIDGHTHLDSMFTCPEFVKYALKGGNTCAVTETAMIANALGYDGVKYFLASCRGLPFRFYFLTPALAPPFPELETSRGFSGEEFDRMIRRHDVVGVGETYWPRALALDPRFLHHSVTARSLGKTCEGHAAGARGERLAAYAASGIGSCHEATGPEEALERLRLGMAVQIREGYIRKELEAIAPLLRELRDLRNFMLTTDLVSPDELVEKGAMMELIRKAVRSGCPPIEAVQMATLNPALYFGLKDMGAVSPGKYGDFVLVEDLDDFRCLSVWVAGRETIRHDEWMVSIRPFRYPEVTRGSIRTQTVRPEQLRVVPPDSRFRIRAVSLVNETITREVLMEYHTDEEFVRCDPDRDLLKMAVIDRSSPDFKGSVGFLHGAGIRSGALATSLIWDTCNILVVGVSDTDMAAAINRLISEGGGVFVVNQEEVLASCPFPVGGILSEAPLPQIVANMDQVEQAIRRLGCSVTRPFMTFQTLCFTGLPFIRLTDRGLLDVRKGELVNLFDVV